MRFYVTFSPHRTAGGTTVRHPFCDGWVAIDAISEEAARQTAVALFGTGWAAVRDQAAHDPSFYPHGRYGEVVDAMRVRDIGVPL